MFENMWTSFLVILILVNGFFVATSFLTVSQDGTTLGSVWGNDIVNDANSISGFFNNLINSGVGTNVNADTNVQATTSEETKVDVFKAILFGSNIVGSAIGTGFAILGFLTQMLFGYFFWLDYLLNPAWHPLIGALNSMFKIIFFLIETMGIVNFAKGFFIFRNLF